MRLRALLLFLALAGGAHLVAAERSPLVLSAGGSPQSLQAGDVLRLPIAGPFYTSLNPTATADRDLDLPDADTMLAGLAVAQTWTAAQTFTSGTTTISTADINGGAIDGVTIGGAAAAAITGTTITAADFVGTTSVSTPYLSVASTGTPQVVLNTTTGGAANPAVTFASGGTPYWEFGLTGGVGDKSWYVYDAAGGSNAITAATGGGAITLNRATTVTGNVTTSGRVIAAAGSASAPAYTWTGSTGSGMYIDGGGVKIAQGMTAVANFVSGAFSLSGSTTFASGTGAVTLNGDTTVATGKALTIANGIVDTTFSTTDGSPAGTAGYNITRSQNVTASAARYARAISANVFPAISSGQTNSGYAIGMWFECLRNVVAAQSGDEGTLDLLQGLQVSVGNYNTHAIAPTTTTAIGVQIAPYAMTGTVTTMIGLNVASPVTGGTLTNYKGIQVANVAGSSAYAIYTGTGAVRFGGALTVADTTASTSTTTGSGIYAGGLGVAGAVYAGGDATVHVIAGQTNFTKGGNGWTARVAGGSNEIAICGVTAGCTSFRFGTGSNTTSLGSYIDTLSTGAIDFYGVSAAARGGIDANGSWVTATAALATTATDGFLYVPTCAGTPTGTPTAKTGAVPIVADTTNHKLYFYSGGAWRDAGP